jgi:hypothetical protein
MKSSTRASVISTVQSAQTAQANHAAPRWLNPPTSWSGVIEPFVTIFSLQDPDVQSIQVSARQRQHPPQGMNELLAGLWLTGLLQPFLETLFAHLPEYFFVVISEREELETRVVGHDSSPSDGSVSAAQAAIGAWQAECNASLGMGRATCARGRPLISKTSALIAAAL